MPRIILYSGKGGVGKTTISAATGIACAKKGLKTIVISLDIAHSLSDSFDLNVDLYDVNKGQPVCVMDNLWIQEIEIHEEIERHWGDIYKYFSLLLSNSGLNEIASEELAIIPGMEDIVFLLYINKYIQEKEFDCLILDCAPTGESLRFVSMPQTLDWYMNKVFNFERRLAKLSRPLAKIISDIPLPKDSYFQSIQNLYHRLKGVDKLLLNREITSVRLVTNAEKMVIRETKRAFMYFCMYGMQIDSVIINRLIPQGEDSSYFKNWVALQKDYINDIKTYFDPVPTISVPVFEEEITGIDLLSRLSQTLYKERNPAEFFYTKAPYHFVSENGSCLVKVWMPGIKKEYVDLSKKQDELLIRVGSQKRYIMLPRKFSKIEPTKAKFEDDWLCVYFE